MTTELLSQTIAERLTQVFVDVNELKNIAITAGLVEQQFPIHKGNAQQIGSELARIFERRGELRRLVQEAARQSVADKDKKFFDKAERELELDEWEQRLQEDFETFLGRSGLLLRELLPLYYESFVEYGSPQVVVSDADIFPNLWGSKDRRVLLRFLLKVASITENPRARDEIRQWYEQDATIDVLNIRQNKPLTRADFNELQRSIGQVDQQARAYLMVVVESQRQADEYLVSLCTGGDGADFVNASVREPVSAKDLTAYLISKLEDVLFRMRHLHTIEFYLPESLLATAVEPHLWEIESILLMRQCVVVLSITERHVVSNTRKIVQKMNDDARANPQDATRLNQQIESTMIWLREDPLRKKLISWNLQWEARWSKLQEPPEKQLNTIVGRVARDEIGSHNLYERLVRKQDLTCIAFAFSPRKIQSAKFQTVLEEALKVGLPVILWANDPALPDAEEDKVISDFLDQYILANTKIVTAADIVELIHSTRTRSFDHEPQVAQMARHLTIVLDNPEREIPKLQRANVRESAQ